MDDPQITRRPILRVAGSGRELVDDTIAVERALEIRIDGRPLVVTLRTPGHDQELALGFLASEGIVRRWDDVASTTVISASCSDEPDVVDLTLAPGMTLDWTKLERHFASTSACGLCGRAHLESLRAGLEPVTGPERLDPAALVALPGRLAGAQRAFRATGGIHACAFLDDASEVRVLREDVGRHNAVDKVAGWLVERSQYAAGGGLMWVSGRAGAEIVLKAARARVPVLVAVGAPSSLAVELAETARMTLIGFLREGRMNVYAGQDRIAAS